MTLQYKDLKLNKKVQLNYKNDTVVGHICDLWSKDDSHVVGGKIEVNTNYGFTYYVEFKGYEVGKFVTNVGDTNIFKDKGVTGYIPEA